jgi:hypothetical protein
VLTELTYRHKRDSCSKETREILENLFRDDLGSYELTEERQTKTTDQEEPAEPLKGDENVLTAQAVLLLSDTGEPLDRGRVNPVGVAGLERYLPPHEVNFEATEAKESFEKKKKKRNYVEFRADYSRT